MIVSKFIKAYSAVFVKKNPENEKNPIDDLKNDEITNNREK